MAEGWEPMGAELSGPVSKQWEQRKSSKIKTNSGVWEHQDPVTPSLPRDLALILFRGRGTPKGRCLGQFPPLAVLPRGLHTCVSIRPLASAREHCVYVCVCFCVRTRLGRALTQSNSVSKRGGDGRALTRPTRPSVRAATLSRPQPVCIRVPYQWLARPGSLITPALCPPWLRRHGAPFPPAGNVAAETLRCRSLAPAPARRQPCGGGGGSGAGKPGGLPGDPGPPLPAPPRGRPGPRQGHSIPAARPLAPRRGALSRPGRPEPRPPPQSGPGPDHRENTFCPRACRPRASLGSLLPASPSSPLLRPRRSLFSSGARPRGPVLIGSQGVDGTAQDFSCPPSPEGPPQPRQAGAAQRCSVSSGRPQSPPPALQGR